MTEAGKHPLIWTRRSGARPPPGRRWARWSSTRSCATRESRNWSAPSVAWPGRGCGGAVDRVFVPGPGDPAGRVAQHPVATLVSGFGYSVGFLIGDPRAAAAVYRDDTDGGHTAADTARFADPACWPCGCGRSC